MSTGNIQMKLVFLEAMDMGHAAFFELRGNLQEGTKFYNDVTQLTVTFKKQISDFCNARKTEKGLVVCEGILQLLTMKITLDDLFHSSLVLTRRSASRYDAR